MIKAVFSAVWSSLAADMIIDRSLITRYGFLTHITNNLIISQIQLTGIIVPAIM